VSTQNCVELADFVGELDGADGRKLEGVADFVGELDGF